MLINANYKDLIMENALIRLIPKKVRDKYPSADFLSEEEQTRYQEYTKRFSGKAFNSLNVPKKGSNIFKILGLNEIGIKTLTIPELYLAFENGMKLEWDYEDGAEILLRSRKDSYSQNNYLSEDLTDKLKIKSFKVPLIIKGLRNQQRNSGYGLEFALSDETEVIRAQDFDYKNDRRAFSAINPDYSIEWDDNGKYIFYAREDGLSGLCLVRPLPGCGLRASC